MQTIEGNIVDILNKNISYGIVEFENGIITAINLMGEARQDKPYILPGFIDAHVHIESSMLVPSEFARLAVNHGTVATISDPHEIANVCGIEGVNYMIENGKSVPFKFHFGAPSCVPATSFETAGAALNSDAIDQLLASDDIFYLSEMMNFPGVLYHDEEVYAKIASAKKYNKPVDGHAPGLRGNDAKNYINAGISTDHECFTKEEAEEKLQYGMKILIREGSAAKNFEALIELLHDYEDQIMFCSDDKHPDSLVTSHINELCARAINIGIDLFKVLKAACINPVKHYKMRVGLLQKGDAADFILTKDLQSFKVIETYIDGIKVSENGKSLINTTEAPLLNHFNCQEIKAEDLKIPDTGQCLPVIEAFDGQLITGKLQFSIPSKYGFYISDIASDCLKIVVVNRYFDAPVAKGFIKNFGLKQGAIASSVAHDSHNIIAVGTDDESIADSINLIIQQKGGISVADHLQPQYNQILPLPVAGLMSNENGNKVADKYIVLDQTAKNFGSPLSAPFMTLSFMALLVIPHLKLSDMGIFDGDSFQLLS